LQNEVDEPGDKRRVEVKAGSEAGARWDGQSIGMTLEAGTELGNLKPPKLVEKSDRGSLIKLTNLGATSLFRKKSGRAGRKSGRQLLCTDEQVDGFEARELLEPGCEAELVLSNSFSTQYGMHFHVDECWVSIHT
jgi:hypothetical protein